MVIVALEGALQEYFSVTSAHAHADVYHDSHYNHLSSERKKESSYSWYEIVLFMMQGVWALLVGAVQWAWQSIHSWIQLMLVAFECSELVEKLGKRFNLWAGLPEIKLG
jgi:hypothetical protein